MKKILVYLLFALVMLNIMIWPVSASEINTTELTLTEIAEIKATGKLSGMVLTNRTVVKLDEEYELVMETYEEQQNDLSASTRATQTKSATKTYRINNSSTGTEAVQFVLYGKFQYNGTTGTCIDAYVDVTNNEPSNFDIVNETAVESGNTAIGYCYALHKRTGTQYGRTMKIRISATGEISYP